MITVIDSIANYLFCKARKLYYIFF